MNKLDVCISFDTTGSMYPCLTQVRKNVTSITNRLFKDIPDLRMSIIAHGDYCDAGNPYTIKIMDLTKDQDRILRFINDVEPTYGGDAPECYELVLNQARTQINWESGREKVLIVIGDAEPHGPTYPDNKNKIDWKNELGLLNEAGIHVYGIHAMPGCRRGSKYFYEEIAKQTNGIYLTLDQFVEIQNIIMAVCYSQESEEALNEFVTIIRDNGQYTRNFKQNIDRLMGKEVTTDTVQKDGLIPVPSGRFQVMPISEDVSIREFIEANGITFQKGRGFYQLTKAEDVQQYKEIIMKDKKTGDMFNGAQVREKLGLLPQVSAGGAKERLKGVHLADYDVFIQSTSYNRKLPKGTCLLYEVSDWAE